MHLPSARPKERTIYEFSVSPWYTVAQIVLALLIPVVFILLTIIAYQFGIVTNESLVAAGRITGVAGLIVAMLPLASALYLRLARHYFITTERVIAVNGWLAQEMISIDYPTITDLTVNRDVFERFVTQSGNLAIDTAGSPAEEITLIHIANPLGVRDQILELVEKSKQLMATVSRQGTAHPIAVAPASANTPIRTDPTVVDSNDNGVVDADEPTPATAAPTQPTAPLATHPESDNALKTNGVAQ